MTKLFWQTLKVAPILVAASLFTTNNAIAQTASTEATANNSVDETLEKINTYQKSSPSNSMSQVTNVNQLRDVSPTDWAYEALRSLVDRYGCIAGFPNQTYRGSQALSRYEFAAGLNSCLNQIERLIASSESVIREDLDTINRLTQEFEAELATLGGRIDNIESRTAFLEDNQFSTTTKLQGEVIFALGNVIGSPNTTDLSEDGSSTEIDSQFTFSDRVRLNFDSSFYGKDRLRVRLQAGNTEAFKADVTGTDSTRAGFDVNNENNIEVSDVYYRFPIGTFKGYVGAAGLDLDDIFEVGNPILESSGTGALSRFARRDPLLFRGTEGAGFGFNWDIVEDKFTLSALYLADGEGEGGAADPSERAGLFNGSFSGGGQLVWTPTETIDVAATYVRSFQTGEDVNLSGSTTTGAAKQPFGEVDTSADKFGLGANFELGERIVLGASGGYAKANETRGNGDGNIWTWQANVSFLDLGKEGSALSFAGGMPPRFTSDNTVEDIDTSFIIEGQYKFPVNDNILLTPGAYVVINPNHNNSKDSILVGLLRTTFRF